jgi:hypothetical protein
LRNTQRTTHRTYTEDQGLTPTEKTSGTLIILVYEGHGCPRCHDTSHDRRRRQQTRDFTTISISLDLLPIDHQKLHMHIPMSCFETRTCTCIPHRVQDFLEAENNIVYFSWNETRCHGVCSNQISPDVRKNEGPLSLKPSSSSTRSAFSPFPSPSHSARSSCYSSPTTSSNHQESDEIGFQDFDEFGFGLARRIINILMEHSAPQWPR